VQAQEQTSPVLLIVIAIQIFEYFMGFNYHTHILVIGGYIYGKAKSII
jgi:hypothetical protein